MASIQLRLCLICRKKDIHLFYFPQNEVRRKQWIENMKVTFPLTTSSRLCTRHFELSQFSNETRQRLNRNAVPTLLPYEPVTQSQMSPSAPTEFQTSTSTQRSSRRSLFKDITGLSPRQQKLMYLVRRKEDLLRKVKKLAKTRQHDLKSLSDVETSPLLEELFKDMSPAAITLMIAQLKHSKRATRDKRWTLEERSIALAIYNSSSCIYRLLRKMIALPSPHTLQTLLSKIPFLPGINRNLFQHLDQCLSISDDRDRMCTLMFDEMPIRAHMQYNPSTDLVEGLVDHGDGRRFNSPAKSALVFMAQGIRRKWKQPLAYYFTDGKASAGDLQGMIRDVLDAMEEANLQVVATVCDMGASNLKALSNMGSSHLTPYFFHNGRQIFTVCDPPHLLKRTRNLFQKYNVQLPVEIAGRTQTMRAEWAHVKEAYEVDKTSVMFRQLPKIRDVHLQTADRQHSTMKVKYAAQVMSYTMAAGIFALVARRDISSPAVGTAQFIAEVDQLFDSFNGTSRSGPEGKDVRCFISDQSPHFDFWNEEFKKIVEWKFVSGVKNRTEKAKPPAQVGWMHSIKAMKGIWNSLRNQGFSYLRLRSFNQDPLENLFAMIRSGCAANENLTVTQFVRSLKAQIINSLSLTRQDLQGSNCLEDDLIVLSNLRALISDSPDLRETIEPSTAKSSIDISSRIEPTDEISETAEDITKARQTEILSVAHVSGHISKRLLTLQNCDYCKNCMISEPTSLRNWFIENKVLADHRNDPIYPSEELVRTVGAAITLLETHLKDASTGRLQNEAILYLGEEVDYSWFNCVTHFEHMKKMIIVGVCQIGIPWYCTRTVRQWKSQQQRSKAVKRKLAVLQNR